MNRRRVTGGVLATLGYLLSPLSWWNDLLVNVPIAYVFATVVGLFVRGWFLPALVVGYWLTNVVGFVLLHVGAVEVVTGEGRPYTRRDFARDLLIGLGYTALVVVLVEVGLLSFPGGIV